MATFLLVTGLVALLGLVVVHELGHFIAARRGGVEVEEFGIGFPPRLFKKRLRGGCLLSINLLPMGGFVKLKGEHDSDNGPGSFGGASLATKAKILVAGVTMNLLVAYVLLTIGAFLGMPQLVAQQFVIKNDATYIQHSHSFVAVGMVEAGSPAAQAGLASGDNILALGPAGHLMTINSTDSLLRLAQGSAGQSVTIKYIHNNRGGPIYRTVELRTQEAVVRARQAGKPIGYLGISMYSAQEGLDVVRSTWSAPIVAAGLVKQFTVLTFVGLGKAVVGLGSIVAGGVTGNIQERQAGQAQASSQVAGPVGIFFVLKSGSHLGFRFVILIIALVSLTLAIMNILPLPALDGGRLWLMLVTRSIRRPLSQRREELINAAGFAFLFSLVILVTVVDVRRFF